MSVANPARPALRPPKPAPVRLNMVRIAVHFALLLCALAFVAPLIMVLAASFSSESALASDGYGFIPREFTTFAYEFILNDPSQLVQAYGVSIFITVVGTAISLLFMSMLGYALSRREFALRRPLSFYVLFTMMFNGGLVPTYILITQYLHIQNTLLVLILPHLVTPWYVLLLRTYFKSLPQEILDAARIDGAGEWRIFTRIALPLSAPALATVGLFTMLTYWNDWWLGLLYIDDKNLVPVQLFLYRILNNVDYLASNPEVTGGIADVPIQSLRMAIAVLAIGPIVAAFFFVQRFLIRGITLGGVKD